MNRYEIRRRDMWPNYAQFEGDYYEIEKNGDLIFLTNDQDEIGRVLHGIWTTVKKVGKVEEKKEETQDA